MTEIFWLYIVMIILLVLWLNTPTTINPNYDKRFKKMVEDEINDSIERQKKWRMQTGLNRIIVGGKS